MRNFFLAVVLFLVPGLAESQTCPAVSVMARADSLTAEANRSQGPRRTNVRNLATRIKASCTGVVPTPPPPPSDPVVLPAPSSTAPGTLTAPGPVSSLTPTFQWTSVSGATGYVVAIRDINADVIVYPSATGVGIPVSGTSLSLPAGVLIAAREYRWDVTAVNATSKSLASANRYFTTAAATPPPPPSGGSGYRIDTNVWPVPSLTRPALGSSYTDPVFGGTVSRIATTNTDHYVKNGWWNANGTRTINTSGWAVIDATTGAIVRAGAPSDLDGSFDPVDPDVWYYHSGTELRKWLISTGANSLVKDFGAPLGNLGRSLDWIDGSGRYFLLKIGAVLRVWDKQTDTLYAGSIAYAFGEGWATISPDGNYVVGAGGGTSPQGFDHTSFRIDHATKSVSTAGVMFWSLCGDHGDVISASNGKTYLITSDCWNQRDIMRADVSLPQTYAPSGEPQQRNQNQQLVEVSWAQQQGDHWSCVARGPFRDWCFWGAYSGAGSSFLYNNEIVGLNVVTGAIRRFVHHRSDGALGNYFATPRISVSWDGSRMMWASDWGGSISLYSMVPNLTP